MVRTRNACFIQVLAKLWNLHELILDKVNLRNSNPDIEKKLEKFVNEIIEKYNYNLEKFNYNVLIASLYETYNFLTSLVNNTFNGEILKSNYIKILTIISPIIPHFASECLEGLIKSKLEWPKVDKEKLKDDNVNIVVQINGKKRANITVKNNILENELIKKSFKNEKLNKVIVGKTVLKSFYVKNRLINILLK